MRKTPGMRHAETAVLVVFLAALAVYFLNHSAFLAGMRALF